MLHKLKREEINILTKRRPFSSESKRGFYFGGVAIQGDWSINVISGIMSFLCGLRWGRAGWLWAADSLALGWLSGGQGRECVTWPEVGLVSFAYSSTQPQS